MADEILVIQQPSRIMLLRNIVTLLDTIDNDSFSNLYSEIYDKCATYGKVLEIKIPRPVWIGRTEQIAIEDELQEKEELELREAYRKAQEEQALLGNTIVKPEKKDKIP